MGMPAYSSLDEFMTELDNYHGGWEQYRDKFLRYEPNNRVIELTAFDKLLEQERQPTRQTAEYITKRRELGTIHDLLKPAGR
jgi:hypothetical protein